MLLEPVVRADGEIRSLLELAVCSESFTATLIPAVVEQRLF